MKKTIGLTFATPMGSNWPHGYKFIYNYVECGDNKISFGDFS